MMTDRATNVARWQHLAGRCRTLATMPSMSADCSARLRLTAERYDELTAYTEDAASYEATLDAMLLPW